MLSGWRAPLVVGLGWLLVATAVATLLWRILERREPGAHAGLAAVLHERHHALVHEHRFSERADADEAIRETAEALVGSAGEELVEHGLGAVREQLARELENLSDEGKEVVDEIGRVLLAPARVSRSFLTKVRGDSRS